MVDQKIDAPKGTDQAAETAAPTPAPVGFRPSAPTAAQIDARNAAERTAHLRDGMGRPAATAGTDASRPTSTSGAKVTVGCKLPHGLIITLEHAVETKLPNGAVDIKFVPVGGEITLNGSNSSRVIGGYGLTEGVDADAFDAWMKSHASYEPVRRGLIFAQARTASAEDQAREQAKVRSGFEPLDPHRPGSGLTPETDQHLPPAV